MIAEIASAVSTNLIQQAAPFGAKIGQCGNLDKVKIDPDK